MAAPGFYAYSRCKRRLFSRFFLEMADHPLQSGSGTAPRGVSAEDIARRVAARTVRGPGHVRVPRPRLVVRVGVVGHRPGRLARAADARGIGIAELEQGIADALTVILGRIRDDAVALREEDAAFYAEDPPLLRIVTGAAMGVDQIAARVLDERLRDRDSKACWRLDMILPTGRDQFVADARRDFDTVFPGAAGLDDPPGLRGHWDRAFGRADTLVALPTFWRRPEPLAPGDAERLRDAPAQGSSPPARGYVLDHTPAANFLLRQIDVLIAVWDGQPAMGPGGTADIAALAVGRGLPVLYLEVGDLKQPPRLLTRVLREEAPPGVRSWYARPVAPDCQDADATRGGLQEQLRLMLAPPAPRGREGRGGEAARDERALLKAFLGEAWPSRHARPVGAAFCALFRGDLAGLRTSLAAILRPPQVTEPHPSEEEWVRFLNGSPDEGEQAVRLKEILHRRFVVSDLLAARYGERYRGLFIAIYALAALAVVAALLGILLPNGADAAWFKLGLMLAELGLLGLIVWLYRRGRRDTVHLRFLEYRALAQALRPMRALATFAEHAPAETAGSTASWRNWYQAATARELGLPQGHLDATFQSSLLRAVAREDVDRRIAELEASSAHDLAVEHGLYLAGRILFFATMMVLGAGALLLAAALLSAHPALIAAAAVAKLLVGSVAICAPALGAAFVAIRFTADFEGNAQRAAGTAAALAAHRAEIEAAKVRQDFEMTRSALLTAARLQNDDLEAFLALHGHKRLELPG